MLVPHNLGIVLCDADKEPNASTLHYCHRIFAFQQRNNIQCTIYDDTQAHRISPNERPTDARNRVQNAVSDKTEKAKQTRNYEKELWQTQSHRVHTHRADAVLQTKANNMFFFPRSIWHENLLTWQFQRRQITNVSAFLYFSTALYLPHSLFQQKARVGRIALHSNLGKDWAEA